VEIEKTGIPVAQVSTVTSVALMVGSNRVITGSGIVHPLGNMDLGKEEEKRLRRAIVEIALETLQTPLTEQKLFQSAV